MNGDTAIGVITRALADRPEVRLAYLFGSRGRGDEGPTSDYDVAVLLDSELAATEGWRVIARLQSDLTRDLGTDDVDLVDLATAPLPLAFRVLRDGRRLLERDPIEGVRYEADIASRWGDFEPWLKRYNDVARDRLRRGELGR